MKQFDDLQFQRSRDTCEGQVPGLANESRATYENNRAKALGHVYSKYENVLEKTLTKTLGQDLKLLKFSPLVSFPKLLNTFGHIS